MKNLLYKLIVLFFLLLFSININSQSNLVKFYGKVTNQEKGLESVLVELLNSSKKRIISSITDKNGAFLFEREIIDSIIYIKASYYGLKSVIKKVKTSNDKIITVKITLDEPKIEELNEIIISTDASIKEEVNKSIYKIKSNDYLKNASSTEILNNVPRLSYDEQNGLLIENRLKGKIYIDGIESSLQSYRTLSISEIDKVEVITTPSARYGSEFVGGIVNIITKTKNERFIKGRLDGGIGLLRKSYNTFPNLSLKTKNLIVKTYYSLLNNDQEINFLIDRITDSDLYFQNSLRKTTITQQNGKVESKYFISNKDFLYASFSISKASEEGLQIGKYSNNFNTNILFDNVDKSDFKRTNINAVYEKKIKENILFIKGKGFWYERNNAFLSNDIQSITKSNLKEFSGEIYYDINEKTLMNKPISYSIGAKIINRKSESDPINVDFNQRILSSYVEYKYNITENFSNYVSLLYENTLDNNSNDFNNQYNIFLPTFILNKKFKKNVNLNYSFSKKIKRPSIYFLNDALVFVNPGVANRGNSNLKPQKNYSQRLTINKKLKKVNISLSSYFNYKKDAINYNSIIEDEVLINFYDNIGKIHEIGINLSFNSKLFNKINTNFSSNFQYNKYETSSNTNSFINKGYSYSLSLSASTKIINDKLSLTYYINQQSPLYDLTTVTKKNPYSYLMLSTNLFKNRLRVDLIYSDILNINSKKEILLKKQNIIQNTIINNKLSNINIGFSFNFGKKFSDYIRKKDIKNDDLLGD